MFIIHLFPPRTLSLRLQRTCLSRQQSLSSAKITVGIYRQWSELHLGASVVAVARDEICCEKATETKASIRHLVELFYDKYKLYAQYAVSVHHKSWFLYSFSTSQSPLLEIRAWPDCGAGEIHEKSSTT